MCQAGDDPKVISQRVGGMATYKAGQARTTRYGQATERAAPPRRLQQPTVCLQLQEEYKTGTAHGLTSSAVLPLFRTL